MASIERAGDGYRVRWRDPDGSARSRRCPDVTTARALRRAVEAAAALGCRWEPPDARAVPALLSLTPDGQVAGGLFPDFLRVRRQGLSDSTRTLYDRFIRRFLAWLAAEHPHRRTLSVDLLTRDAVEAWYGDLLEGEGGHPPLSLASARVAVTAVWSAWEWAYDSDRYGDDVGRPRRFEVRRAPGTPAVAPTWEQMDQALEAALLLARDSRTEVQRQAWHTRARTGLVMRWTGLRVEQVRRLTWADLDLEGRRLVVRGELGKSDAERAGRTLPVAVQFADLLRVWRLDQAPAAPIAADAAARSSAQAWRRAWALSGVPERVWAPPGRKGQPHHAFRKGYKTGLAELGIPPHVRDYLVGHHRGIDEHYLDTWREAEAAVQRIPPLAPEVLRALASVAAPVGRRKVRG